MFVMQVKLTIYCLLGILTKLLEQAFVLEKINSVGYSQQNILSLVGKSIVKWEKEETLWTFTKIQQS